MANKFKKGDEIIVISGSDKGKLGKISEILDNKVLVEGVNLRTTHKKPTMRGTFSGTSQIKIYSG